MLVFHHRCRWCRTGVGVGPLDRIVVHFHQTQSRCRRSLPNSNAVYGPGASVICNRRLQRIRRRRRLIAAWPIILPVVIRCHQRTVAIAQFEHRVTSTGESPRSLRLGPSPRTMIGSSPPPLPRMKPAITMSLPVLTNARVLMFPNFEPPPGFKIVDLNQTHPSHIRIAFQDRGVGTRIERGQNSRFQIIGRCDSRRLNLLPPGCLSSCCS